jgi:ABC-2 type transport system permease protein
MFLSFFSVFRDGAQLMNDLLQNFPPEFKAAFGFADVDLSTINGYLAFLTSYLVLIGAVFAMKLGVGVLSEETRAKTADFLYSKPVKRHQIVSGKLISTLINLVLQNIVLYIITLSGILIIGFEGLDVGIYTYFIFSILLVQLFFVGIGSFIAVLLKKIKAVMPITLSIVFLFFIIELINQSILDKALTYFTPFSYFKGSSILTNSGYEINYLIVDLLVFIVFTLFAYLLNEKKDIHSV